MVASLLLSLVTLFEYEVNIDYEDLSYPYLRGIVPEASFGLLAKTCYVFFMMANELANYLLFSFLNLTVEVLIMLRLRQVLNERMKQSSADPSSRVGQLKLKHNNRSEQKAFMTVIMSGLINFVLRLPEILQPVYLIVQLFYADTEFYVRYCAMTSVCPLAIDLSSSFFVLTLALNFFVFYRYNIKFNACVKGLFGKRIKQTK